MPIGELVANTAHETAVSNRVNPSPFKNLNVSFSKKKKTRRAGALVIRTGFIGALFSMPRITGRVLPPASLATTTAPATTGSLGELILAAEVSTVLTPAPKPAANG